MRPGDYKFVFNDQEFILTPERALYWKEENSLLLADLHLSKAGYFRKEGILVPPSADKANYQKLTCLLDYFSPEKLIILGDLSHSEYNRELEEFLCFRQTFSEIQIFLILGNHDILERDFYHKCDIIVVDHLAIYPFIFTHEPLNMPEQNLYNLAGHIHPSVSLKGKARQNLRLPCFYFSGSYGLLPAFGAFTGLSCIKTAKNDDVFVVVNEKVIKV